MHPYIIVFGKQIPVYGIMALLGVALGLIYIAACRKESGLSRDDRLFSYMYGVIGAFIGAKLLSIITVLPDIVDNFNLLFENPELFLQTFILSGFVFYGGLYGAVGGVCIYARQYKMNFWDFVPALVPAIPLVHAAGRVGCFLEGCCYGVPSERFGIVLKNSFIAPNNIPIFPVQLAESAGNLIIFVVLAVMAKKRCRPRIIMAIYMTMYSVMRFVLEFFRYDSYRGFIGPVSLSQAISVITLAVAVYLIAADRKKCPVL